ncbi:hypothetical protein EHI8A_014390 [Entamoeba histolytica HM-1:IMSS-B]|uniref:SMP-LTD domain-containing protein n=1 Tax=Entamoeba histolytica HM-1:IMSS-B TaxID=885319 RepID=M3ULI0_ENTH1|nr:hypothetical protein EHI8A_014390 [Entamoeba histolytica HM-1:IMSS-B]
MYLFITLFPFIFVVVLLIFLRYYLPSHFRLIPPPPDLFISKPLPTPPPKNISIMGADEWISVYSNPLQLKSDCVIIYGKEEHLIQFSVDSENIIIRLNNQTYKSKINALTITNIYFSKTKINKNNLIQLTSPTDIIPLYDSVCIRFREGYQMEYWYYYLKACQKGRRKYYTGDEAFVSLFKELNRLSSQNSKESFPWIQLSNFFIGRIFYTNAQTQNIVDKIKGTLTRKLQGLVCTMIPSIKCTDCSLGCRAPLIKSIISHIPKETDGRFLLDFDIVYNSSNFIEISLSFVIPYFLEEPLPIRILVSLPQLSGTCRADIPDVPSRSIYLSFHQLPKFTLKYQIQIGRYYFVPTKAVDSIIHFIVEMVIVKKMILPSLLRIPIPQISEIARPTQFDTYNPFVDTKYKLPDLPCMSDNLNTSPYIPDVLYTEDIKKYNLENKKFDIFKFSRQVATKFFDLAVSGEFKKDFRSEKKLEKHQKIILKEQQKQEKKELKSFKRREKRHTIQTTLEELEKVNDDIKKNERLDSPKINMSANKEELLSAKSDTILTERKQQSLNFQQITGRKDETLTEKDKIIKKELSEQKKDNLITPNEKAKLSTQKESPSFCSFELMKQKNFTPREERDKPDNFFVHTLPFQEETKSQEGTPKRCDSSNELERVRSASPLCNTISNS